MVRVRSVGGGEYMLVAADDTIGLYNVDTKVWVGKLPW